jgi:hypothetical protein
MSEWLFNSKGTPCLILDGIYIRNDHGYVASWIFGPNVHSSKGEHIGWVEGGVFYDIQNRPILFTRNHTAYLPTKPGLTGTRSMPGFASPPGRPGVIGTKGRPGLSQSWSTYNPPDYFK